EAFRLALRACGDPAEVWMVGDNPIADIEGAEAVGIRAIRVRNGAATLTDVVGIVACGSPVG
ncbi:MAG TPA: HAD hydrolase-like protein, partial [Gaiellaceae bacterium]|nr:HAD hydrolase-like protein [Gaiellaceae bacterium]